MISIDAILIEAVKENIITLGFIYAIFKNLFPDSKVLKAVGDAFKARFGK
jgi:hypothetical protein